MRDIYSVYYMRLFAVVLIVNSHFNPKHIIDFKPFALYSYLGNLGNMIFFFISSYVLTIGFKKYESQYFRWIIYRLFYLILTILSIRILFKIIEDGSIPNIIVMVVDLFDHIDFISVMLYLSIAFPFMYSMNKKIRISMIAALFFIILFLTQIISLKFIVLSSYCLIFFLGIAFAKKEVIITSMKNWKYFICVCLSLALFLFAKMNFDYLPVTNFSKICFIIFLFHFLENFRLEELPSWFNFSIKEIAKLSLYIYLTHFYFINFSYQLNMYLGLIIIFIVVTPICYIEDIALKPVVRSSKKFFLNISPNNA